MVLLQFVAPPWAGRIPLRVGEPAGGSLTADKYKFATTGPWAMVVCFKFGNECKGSDLSYEIPLVWEEFLPESNHDHKKAEDNYLKAVRAWNQKAKEAEKAGKPPPAKPKTPSPRMQEGEDLNFLRFCTFLHMIIGTTISKTPQAHDRIKQLLQYFLLRFLEVIHPLNMR
jgi:hypothetical protein